MDRLYISDDLRTVAADIDYTGRDEEWLTVRSDHAAVSATICTV